MKKIVITFCISLFVTYAMAQVPDFLNYQAVLRDNSGNLISEEVVEVRLSIIDNAIDGTALYEEIHSKTTNQYGVVELTIGNGSVVTGNFSNINWALNKKYLKVEVDAGNGYVDMGTVQLLSVPYAMHSRTANYAEGLGSASVYSPSEDTLFVVKDYDGNVVFAVFPDGAQVIVNETAKGKIGGFAVSGRNPAKADMEILRITQDSTRIYVNDTVSNKGKIGGFAVSGRNPAKNTSAEILFVTADSTRVYINEDSGLKGKIGGFAVSGRNPAKGIINDYLQVTKDSTRVYIEDSGTKGKIGGFAVSGRNPAKGTSQPMFISTIDSTRIFTQDTIGGFSVRDNSGSSRTSYMKLTPLNYFIGHESGELVRQDTLNPSRGKHNTFFGYQSGKHMVYGYQNVLMGYQAGYAAESGAWNIFLGNKAGYSADGALSNIFIGKEAGYSFPDGIHNIYIGSEAGRNVNNAVFSNIFIGNNTGKNNYTGHYNTYVGSHAGFNCSGSSNTFLGNNTGYSNYGDHNVLLGAESGIYSLEGHRNVYIGYRAGYRIYGSRNVFIGNAASNTNFDSYDYNNCIAIGDSVIVTGDNQIRIGNSNATSLYLEGAHNVTSSGGTALYINSSGKVGTLTSSKRYKTNIVDLEINTSDIYKLRPVSYTSINDKKRYFGLIAEEVASVIPGLAEFVKAKDVIPGSESEEMIPNSVHYPILSVLLLKEIQKHEETIKDQSNHIKKLEDKNLQLEERIKKLEELILK